MDRGTLESRIDALYQLVPGEFVAARNALAKELAGAGDKEAANRVKKLAKATVTAWAVNRVVAVHADDFQAAVDAGQAVRAALGGKGSIQEAMSQRRDAVDALTAAAVAQLESLGSTAGPDAQRRMSRTIEALVTAPGDEQAPGRLTHDLDPPGFEAVMGMALAAPAAKRRKKKPAARKRPKGAPKVKTRSAKAAEKGPKPRAEANRPRSKSVTPAQTDSAPTPAADKERRAELRAARSARLKRVREARSELESSERRVAAARRAVERTERAEAAARAELDRAASATEEARKRLGEAETRMGESQARVDAAQRAVAELDASG